MDFNSFKPLQDFGEFKSKVTQSAMAAAEVVQKLNDLDELAEDDEYLKTDGLNVTQRDRPANRTIESTSSVQPPENRTPVAQPPLSTVPGEQDATTNTPAAMPFVSPEERAQQLIAQALYQTPLSSAPASRRDSRSTSFADYASAKEEEVDVVEEEEDPSPPTTARSKDWSLLDTVLSPDPTSTGAKGREDEEAAQWRYDYSLGSRNINQEMNQETTTMAAATTTAEQQKQNNNPYVLSVVAKLMDGAADGGDGNETDSVTKSSSEGMKDTKDGGGDALDARRMGGDASRMSGEKADVHAGKPEIRGQSLDLKIAGLDYDSDDSSSDDSDDSGSPGRDVESDPIMSLIQRDREAKAEKASPPPRVDHVSGVQEEETLLPPQEEMPARKDPNRFFRDLDRRLANEAISSQKPVSKNADEEAGSAGLDYGGVQEPVATPQSFAEATDKFQWLRNVAAPRILDSVSKNVKLMERSIGASSSAAASNAGSRKQTRNGASGNEINVVVSSSLLGAEEHAELERLKQSTNQSLVTTLVDVLKSNPRFAFIGFTLLLSSFVYFYSRKRTEDDVTR